MKPSPALGRLVVAATALAVTALPARAASTPRSTSGALSVVTLVDVSRLPPELLQTVLPGARDGLVFMFLIVKRTPSEGFPTVRKLADFEIDQASYQSSTAAQLGAAFEPLILVEDASSFLARMEPGSTTEAAVPEGLAYVMLATIGGAELPDHGSGALQVEVGFDGQTEAMPFRFTVPPKLEANAGTIPAVPGEPGAPQAPSVPAPFIESLAI